MNDHDEPEMEALEEAPVAPEAMGLPPMMMGAPMPAHKQLYQFFWGGCAVLFGCLLRFECYADGWDATVYQPDLQGPVGLWTVGGGIVAFTSILFIGAQLWCMKHRRVLLGPIVIMLCICAWSWIRVTRGMGCENLGLIENQDGTTEYHSWSALFYNADTFVDYWSHVGVGFLFTVFGSTYVVVIFLKALLGIGGPKKASAAEASGRARGRRR